MKRQTIKKAFLAAALSVIMMMQAGYCEAMAAEAANEEPVASESILTGDETNDDESDIMLISENEIEDAVNDETVNDEENADKENTDDETTADNASNIDSIRAIGINKETVKVTWSASEDATNYEVYYKAASASEYVLAHSLDAIDNQEEYSAEIKLAYRKAYNIRIIPINKTREEIIEGEAKEITYDNSVVVSLDHQKYTYKECVNDIRLLAQKYPEYVTYTKIGESVSGRALYDVTLGNPEAANSLLVVCCLHAREYITSAVVMKQLEYYLDNYTSSLGTSSATDGSLTPAEVFSNVNVHYVMMANPDGVTMSQNGKTRWKANARGVNLNNNWSYGWKRASSGSAKYGTSKGKSAFSEPETKAIKALTISLNNSASHFGVINYHAMGRIIYGRVDASKVSTYTRTKTLQFFSTARTITGYAPAYDSGSSKGNGNYREYLMYSLDIPSITLELGKTIAPCKQYEYNTEYNKNKTVVLEIANKL